MRYLLLLLLAGFALPASGATVRIERLRYNGWADSYRLSNGIVDLVIVPSVGRIMRYGFVGGPNVLWESAERGKNAKPGEWPNVGGDKIWPWPQNEWPQRTGRSWPPPAAADQAPHQVFVVAPDTLRLVSPPVVGYGLRIEREIRLSPTGTGVTLTSRFVKVRAGADFPVAVWSVTQMPVPDLLLARLSPGQTLPTGYQMLSPRPWKSIRVADGVLFAERPSATSAKIGIDADLLAWTRNDLLFTQRAVPSASSAAAFRPGERAQIYSNSDGPLAYIELELTAPRQTLARGDTQTLTVVWELERLSGPDAGTPTALAARLRARFDTRPTPRL